MISKGKFLATVSIRTNSTTTPIAGTIRSCSPETIGGGLLVRDSTGLARSEGIRAGDLVLAINSQRLDSVEDFRHTLSRLPTGHTVALLVMRDLRLAYVPVRITARPASP